jgi:hypothetical protein
MKKTELIPTKIGKIRSGDIILDKCGKELEIKEINRDFSTNFGRFVFYIRYVGGGKQTFFQQKEVLKVERS